jgi:CubicO group peptidase (beta-lactamase class C family)
MRAAFSRNFEKDLEIGASMAMTYRGKTVLDLWAGHADPERTRPWQEDTIVFVASTTKVPMVIALLMVIDRGLIDLDRTVAHYWPEFAQGGKAAVTVRDVLTHQAGVPSLDPPSTLEVLRDWNAVTARIAGRAALVRRGAADLLPLEHVWLHRQRAHPPRRWSQAAAILPRRNRRQDRRRFSDRTERQG